jgi:hypothetical protein
VIKHISFRSTNRIWSTTQLVHFTFGIVKAASFLSSLPLQLSQPSATDLTSLACESTPILSVLEVMPERAGKVIGREDASFHFWAGVWEYKTGLSRGSL